MSNGSFDHKPKLSISLIIPTYREAENISPLLQRIDQVRRAHKLSLDLWIMDDDSQDGTEEAVQRLDLPWVHLIVRDGPRGLSPAVVEGLQRAQGEVLMVMDADLSHPPEKIPELVQALENGADFVIGSRYVAGGATEEGWGLARWLNSRVATLLARPFTKASDPMSGFFALRRETFLQADKLNPIGYKIGLELLVKCHCRRVAEVPIFFSDRRFGQSKLTLKEQLRYLHHLRRLFIYKYGGWARMLQFGTVGAIGTVVNLATLTLLELTAGFGPRAAIAGGIVTSVISNFVLNRRYTFPSARRQTIIPQFLRFIGASSLGLLTNYQVAILTLPSVHYTQLAALCGIAAGMIVNYLLSRFFVFEGFATASKR